MNKPWLLALAAGVLQDFAAMDFAQWLRSPLIAAAPPAKP